MKSNLKAIALLKYSSFSGALFLFFCTSFFMLYFFAAIEQPYSAADIIMNNAHVMLHNSVTLACSVPAHLSDHVTVIAWRVDETGLAADPIELNKDPPSYGSVHILHGTRSQNVLKGPRPQVGPHLLCGILSIMHPDISQMSSWVCRSS